VRNGFSTEKGKQGLIRRRRGARQDSADRGAAAETADAGLRADGFSMNGRGASANDAGGSKIESGTG
jgi:hypothetical protein